MKIVLPRPLLFALGVLPALFAIAIFAFIARFSMAHDESRCPFREVTTRSVGDAAQVREEARRCIDEVEEHRWMTLREGHEPLELGRFPLEAAQIDLGFPWEAREEEGRVVVTVQNRDRGELIFREPTP